MCKNLISMILFFLGEFSNYIVTIGNFVITTYISKKCVRGVYVSAKALTLH